MKRNVILMSSVSTVALAAVATAAHAADLSAGVVEAPSVPDGFTLSIEGGALFGTNTIAEDKLGGSAPSGGIVNIQDNIGYRAAISLGKQIDPMWDVRVNAAINHQLTSTSDFSYTFTPIPSGGSGGSAGPTVNVFSSLETKFDYETMDFEAGYRPALSDTMEVRLFAGLRGLHYNDSIDKMGAESLASGGPDKVGFGANTDSEFYGVGPRIGVEASAPLGDSMFGVSGMVAGAALFGVERDSGSYNYFIYSGGSGANVTVQLPGNEETKVVYNLEAALGLDMHLDQATTVTLGYRAEGLFGIDTNISGGSGGSGSDSRWTHGPTLKLTGYFD